ncbi:MAG: hypothetical protein EPO26_17835 [Chloroflexota bacterium]|nr:MAG: hypothetical protein EPO26_17835 [Chloroflexota bacterium]
MELRAYWAVIWRRRLLVAAVGVLSLIAAIVSVVALPQPLPSYQATVILGVLPRNVPALSGNQYGDYYLYIASEFLNDDVMAIVESRGFYEAILRRNAGRPEGSPSGVIRAKKSHRVVTFTVSSDRGSDALAIAQGIGDVLLQPTGEETRYVAAFSAQDPVITVLDPPRLTVEPGVQRGALDVAVRTLLGLIVAIAVAFLLHYLDDTIRDAADAERLLGLPVLGEIPREG